MNEPSATAIDQHLFEQHCAEYYELMFRLVLRLTGNKEEAQDIAQTAFVRFLRLMKRKQWKLEINFIQAYLTKIAINLCRDMWKERGKEKPVSYDDDKTRESIERDAAQTDESVANLENRIYFKELYQALPMKVLLSGLDDYEAQIFLLRRVDGVSIKEIAETVGKDDCRVRYDLQKVEARIRYRVHKVLKAGEYSLH